MTYDDGLADIGISTLLAFHRVGNCLATVTAARRPARFDRVDLDGKRTRGSHEKPHGDDEWINGGFFVLSTAAVDRSYNDDAAWEKKPMQHLALAGQLADYRHDGFWQPMDTPRDKNHLEDLWSRCSAALKLWPRKVVGAEVAAFPLARPIQPNLFKVAQVARGITSIHGDIIDFGTLAAALRESKQGIVLYLAAQATRADCYQLASDTFAPSLSGTVSLLDALRDCPAVEAAVIVASSKRDVPTYSASKSCVEIASAAWKKSFFIAESRSRIATARTGNLIGGGDWAADRLPPELVSAVAANQAPIRRISDAIRPRQHVLDAPSGYQPLAERLCGGAGARYTHGWYFGRTDADHLTVGEVAKRRSCLWGEDGHIEVAASNFQKETETLRLNVTRAHKALGSRLRWSADKVLRRTREWYRAWYARPREHASIRALMLAEFADYASIP